MGRGKYAAEAMSNVHCTYMFIHVDVHWPAYYAAVLSLASNVASRKVVTSLTVAGVLHASEITAIGRRQFAISRDDVTRRGRPCRGLLVIARLVRVRVTRRSRATSRVISQASPLLPREAWTNAVKNCW